MLIVGLMILLMMTGMPLGIVTMFVSILTALMFFGYNGMYLVSTNAFGLLEKYPLIAVPLFVLMASILEIAGVAEDLFDAYLPLVRYEQQPGYGLAVRKEVLRRRGAVACALIRAPGPILSRRSHKELDHLIARLDSRLKEL